MDPKHQRESKKKHSLILLILSENISLVCLAPKHVSQELGLAEIETPENKGKDDNTEKAG